VKFLEGKDVAVVGCFDDDDSKLKDAFNKAADTIDDIEFAIIPPGESGSYDVKTNKIVVLKTFDEMRVEYDV